MRDAQSKDMESPGASAWGWRQGITLGRVAFSLLVGTSPSDPAVLGADGNTRGSRACGVL